uniref:Uncharacterized protein n=1 Tax=Anguilla anguilla TaxID=7936 RepID=A0A0E9PP34_ANGAN
MSHLYSSC